MKSTSDATEPRPWLTGQVATQRRFIPNVPVLTHRGDQRLFYDDLIKDRVVIIQFMSIQHHGDYPVTNNLRNVQRLLGEAAGRDVFMYSISSDPQHDSIDKLSKFASQFQPGSGWSFITGDAHVLGAIKDVFFVHGDISGDAPQRQASSGHQHSHHPRDCSMGLLRYGNDASGLWASVPTKADAAMIVERLSWIRPQKRQAGLTRGGPHRLG